MTRATTWTVTSHPALAYAKVLAAITVLLATYIWIVT